MTSKKRGHFWSGTSGLVLAEPNKASYPEEWRSRSRLAYYAHLFNSLEINSSFYKVPQPATFQKWANEVAAPFRFTVKLWQGITHVKDLVYRPEDVDTFMEAAGRLGDKKGSLLVQLPPGLRCTHTRNLQSLLERIRRSDPANAWDLAVEFRHPGWYTDDTYRLLDRYTASIVLHDMPASATNTLNTYAPFIYLRYHGVKGDYRGGYEEEFLRGQAENIEHWLSSGLDVYAYFNNTIGDAVANLTALNKFVSPHTILLPR